MLGATSRSLLSRVLPFGAVALFIYLSWSQGICTEDDAFVSFRYARNFSEGYGLVFNPGERVEGYTNFLWTLILAGAIHLGGDPVAVSRLLGIAFGAGVVLLTWRMAALVVGESPWLRFLPTLLVAMTPPLAVESAMGLETSMFALLVLWGCYRCVVEFESTSRVSLHAAIFALAALTRPEGTMLYGLAVGACSLHALRDPHRLIRFLSRSLAVFAIPVGAYVLWRISYYGHPFPNTFYAKTGGGWEQVELGLAYFEALLRDLWWIPVPLLYLISWARASRPVVLVLQAVTTVYVLYVILVGGDFKPTHRFFVPIFAPLWLLVSTGLSVVRDLAAARSLRAGRFAEAMACASGVALALSLPLSFGATYHFAELRREVMADPIRREVSRWFRDHTPPDEVLVQASAGLIPYYSGVRVIDLWGLTDPVIARSPHVGDPVPGHRRSNPQYLLSREPLYFFFMPGYGIFRRTAEQIRGLYAVERQLLRSPEFHARYELRNERFPGGYLYVFRRRDG